MHTLLDLARFNHVPYFLITICFTFTIMPEALSTPLLQVQNLSRQFGRDTVVQQVMARVIAANNILNALFMVIASVIVMLVSWSIPVLFFAVGVMNLVVLALMLTAVDSFS